METNTFKNYIQKTLPEPFDIGTKQVCQLIYFPKFFYMPRDVGGADSFKSSRRVFGARNEEEI